MGRRFCTWHTRKILGLILFSAGCGMLLVLLIPWWGCIAAVILIAVGGILLFGKEC